MGQAKQKGTYEERKEQAISEGRFKVRKPSKRLIRQMILEEMKKRLVDEDGFQHMGEFVGTPIQKINTKGEESA